MEIILPYFIAIALCGLLLYFLTPIAKKVGLVDRPNDRKRHDVSVPLIGGIAMGISFPLSMLLFPIGLESYRILFFCVGALLVVGVLDDHQDIPAWAKFVTQMVIATLLVFLDEKVVFFIGDIFDTGISQGLNVFAPWLTVIAIVAIINAFNMIDGHDGLAALVTIISLGSLLFLSTYNGVGQEHFFFISLFITVVATFLIFNHSSFVGRDRQVYMGDAGSMFLGLIVAYFLIELSQRGAPVENFGIPAIKPSAVPWIIGLPFLDQVSVMAKRIMKGRKLWIADRGHIHHFFLDAGFGKHLTLALLVLIHGGLVIMGILGTVFDWPDWILFWGAILVLLLYLGVARLTPRKIKTNRAGQ
ncbi:MAG: hypothetical protein CL402_10955 [Acidiferrobacteraceae bacterium]|nr:hypothetical protein [Acidiferrobacteraceae bacterium]